MTNNFKNLHILTHPLIQHKLTLMRDKNRSAPRFRQLMREIALLMGYEVTRHLPTISHEVETPLARLQATMIEDEKVAVVPILRAGLVMADGLMDLLPTARIGHIGLYRDHETKRPVEYMVKVPLTHSRTFILVDPMLATGYSAVYAVDILNQRGIEDHNILFLSLVAAPEGVKVFSEAHPNVRVYTAALDEKLDENAYIVPGLGDAGDRLFGTE
ncbi:uracil phosphoribosyltransferase [Caedimonas varicaedens]|jgi:uracil phosphoribosyltransferase|uniref:Uracil phosphoribosyltransferase n=1 Tax=Caedimonas varicaedens TaxID=1629334 RepID=A0A0K8MEP1_9PROT|nr:uracil phosphoribosyltransferase [Caedimonas varicaedens]